MKKYLHHQKLFYKHSNRDKGIVLYWYNIQEPVRDIKPPVTALPTSWVGFPLSEHKIKLNTEGRVLSYKNQKTRIKRKTWNTEKMSKIGKIVINF